SRARQDLSLPILDGPAQSLAMIYDLLSQHPGWCFERLCTFTTADLVRMKRIHDVESRIESFVGGIRPDDFLFVYYIGHARRNPEDAKESLALALPNFDLPARFLISACYMAPISRVFLLFDCCFAERVAASMREQALTRKLLEWVSNLFE